MKLVMREPGALALGLFSALLVKKNTTRRHSMADIALLKPKLTRLKLSGMMDSLQLRFDEAVEEKWSFSDFLERLLQDEVERRDSKQLARRLVRSGLSAEKTLETFDFSFNPKIHEPSIREIALCNFMKDKENVL